MSQIILAKYRTLRPINDDETVNRLLAILVGLPINEHQNLFGHSAHAGRFFLFKHDSAPGKVLEYVPDIESDSSITTLYDEHPIFESRQTLIKAREEIIHGLDEILLSVPNSATVLDRGRGKQLSFPELGTAQLLDTLAIFTHKDIKTA
jgi:hypothetical protein